MLKELRLYSAGRKEKQINDLVMLKLAQEMTARHALGRWRRVFERRQCVRFLETSLDFARLRIGF